MAAAPTEGRSTVVVDLARTLADALFHAGGLPPPDTDGDIPPIPIPGGAPTLSTRLCAPPRVIAAVRSMIPPPNRMVTAWSPYDATDMSLMTDPCAALRECLDALPHAEYASGEEGGPVYGDLPCSTYEHDCTQLEFGRVSAATGKPAPRCIWAGECTVGTVPMCSTDALGSFCGMAHAYLTAEQEEVFQQTGQAPDGPCLLCIRRDVAILIQSLSGNITPGCTVAAASIVLPFTNLANIHGGYRSDVLMAAPFLIGQIPRPNGNCVIAHNPETGRFGVCQSALMWTPDPTPGSGN